MAETVAEEVAGTVLVEEREEGRVALVTLNRPQVLNAMNTAMGIRLNQVMAELAERARVRVIVLTGAGERAFCAGGDLKERNTMTPREWVHQHRIGEEGKGFRYILSGMNAERILIASEALGDGFFFVDRAVDYARQRVVFGRPIGQNQGVQFPIARGPPARTDGPAPAPGSRPGRPPARRARSSRSGPPGPPRWRSGRARRAGRRGPQSGRRARHGRAWSWCRSSAGCRRPRRRRSPPLAPGRRGPGRAAARPPPPPPPRPRSRSRASPPGSGRSPGPGPACP